MGSPLMGLPIVNKQPSRLQADVYLLLYDSIPALSAIQSN
jgi:hypothetical protein